MLPNHKYGPLGPIYHVKLLTLRPCMGYFAQKAQKGDPQVAWYSHGHKVGTFMPWSPSKALDLKSLPTWDVQIPNANILGPKHGESVIKLDLNIQWTR